MTTQIDWLTITNWIVSGFIGLAFGLIGSWVSYRYDRKRDNIAWEREKEKINEQWKHEISIMERQFQERLAEIEKEDRNKVVADMLRGIDNPQKTIQAIQASKLRLERKTGTSIDEIETLLENLQRKNNLIIFALQLLAIDSSNKELMNAIKQLKDDSQ